MTGPSALPDGQKPASLPLVVLENVGYVYPDAERRALDDINLCVRRGEFIGIVGPTGAGKSTLLLALNGIVPQFFGGRFFGRVSVAGLDTVEVPTSALAARVGVVLEDPETQITAPAVEDEVAFALENLCVPAAEIRARVTAALAAVGLLGLERRHPANLSGGQKQRLAIAAALALAPDLIVLDEPTSQLDPLATREVFALLRQLNRERGIAVVMASHASEELAASADRVVLLAGGRIVREGTPDDVFGEIATLMHHDVRPPDIAQAYSAVAEALGEPRAAPVPVTLDDAPAAFAPFRAALDAGGGWTARAARAVPGEPVLEASNVVYAYPDGTRALNGVDLTIRRGEFVALAGRNGCGKSTLVRHFLHLVDPTSGTVRVDGMDAGTVSVPELARRVGYVAQNAHAQLFCDSVGAEVAFALRMMKRPSGEVDAAVAFALAAMRLEEAANVHPMALGRGNRLRVAIAATLALGADIIVFDEPTTGQDWRGALAVFDICRELNGLGKTVLVVTHHLYLLPGYADRLVVMADGRVTLDGSLPDVLYDVEALAAASLVPPQTVAFAAGIDALARPERRPLSAADLAACVRPGAERAA